ncbi:MAG: hypothetical protein IJD79_04245 [Clostridia bacterium]|nr:hypothetical protein [Clostridia bacterium]
MAKNVIMRTKDGKILHLECHDSIPSTHSLARSYARIGYADGYVVFSENQTEYNSLGQKLTEGSSEHGVYLSCILRPSIFPSQAGFLGAMSAVAFVTALEEQTDKTLGIGWVSDIFCEGERIGTIATEGKLDSFMAYEYIIISFTVKLTDEYFPPRLSDMIKKVFESENTSIPLIIAKNILSKFFALYPKRIKTPEKFMENYKRKFILGGVKARYIEDGKKKRCKILGVESADGRLIVETKDGAIKHISGNRNIIIPDKIKLKSTSK